MNAPQYIIDTAGNRTGVILDVATYQEMIEQLEELEDIRLAAAARADDPVGLPAEEAWAEIERDRTAIWGSEG